MTILASENFDTVPNNTAAAMRARGWDADDSDYNGRCEVFGIPGVNGSAQSFRNGVPSASQNGAFPRLPLSVAQGTGAEVYARVYHKFEAQNGGDYVFYDDSAFGANNEQKLWYLLAEPGGTLAWRNEMSCRAGASTSSGILRVDMNQHDDTYTQNTGSAFTLTSHVWYCIEMYNLISGNNVANGAFKVWVTDLSGAYNSGAETLIMDYTSINMRKSTNPNPAASIDKFWLSNNYGGADNPTHPDLWVYYDEIVVSTTKIGSASGGGGGISSAAPIVPRSSIRTWHHGR